MANQKSLALTREEQIEEFEFAEQMVREEFDEDMPYGDVVKVLAEAYTGKLDSPRK